MDATIDKIEDIRQVNDYYVHGTINGKHFRYRVEISKLPEKQPYIIEMIRIILSERLTTSEKRQIRELIEDKFLTL